MICDKCLKGERGATPPVTSWWQLQFSIRTAVKSWFSWAILDNKHSNGYSMWRRNSLKSVYKWVNAPVIATIFLTFSYYFHLVVQSCFRLRMKLATHGIFFLLCCSMVYYKLLKTFKLFSIAATSFHLHGARWTPALSLEDSTASTNLSEFARSIGFVVPFYVRPALFSCNIQLLTSHAL